jgi:hypothetical protein
MKPTDKSHVYRQLYHAANGMENRFLRPSASSITGFSQNGPSPLLNAKVIGLAVGIGVSIAAVFAAVRSLGKEEPQEKKDQEEGDPNQELVTEVLVDEDGEEISEVVIEESLEDEDQGLWSSILDRLGLGPKEEDPGIVDEGFESSTEPVRIETPNSKDEPKAVKPSARGKPKNSEEAPPKDQSPTTPSSSSPEKEKVAKGLIAISRGHQLEKSKVAKRESQKSNALFTGRYLRLARANLSSSELLWATRLVKMGVPISGRMGKSLLPVVKSVIVARAKAHGLDPMDMLKVASMESGGDPNAVSSTGAIGVYQFTATTAKAFGLNNRFDLDANVEAGMLLAKENLRSLPAAVSGALAMYIAHQIGISSAKEVLASPVARKITDLRAGTQRSIRVNVGGKSKTVGEYLEANRSKLESSYSQQLAATPFRGSIRVHLLAGSPTEQVSSIDVPPLEEQTQRGVAAPSTVVVPETPSTPDPTFHAKVDLQKPTATASNEQATPANNSGDATSPYQESEAKFQSAFVSNNGPLIVM